MPERKWKLGVDLSTYDNLLDGLTFDDLLLAVHCNCREVTPAAVLREWKDMLKMRLEDANYLLENNIEEICRLETERRNA